MSEMECPGRHGVSGRLEHRCATPRQYTCTHPHTQHPSHLGPETFTWAHIHLGIQSTVAVQNVLEFAITSTSTIGIS